MRVSEGQILPEETRLRVQPEVQRFRERKLSGHVTITLHFKEGEDMPSVIALEERGVGERRKKS